MYAGGSYWTRFLNGMLGFEKKKCLLLDLAVFLFLALAGRSPRDQDTKIRSEYIPQISDTVAASFIAQLLKRLVIVPARVPLNPAIGYQSTSVQYCSTLQLFFIV
jgi:hypothetical protein